MQPKFFLLTLTTVLFMACNNGDTSQTANETTTEEYAHNPDTAHHAEHLNSGLALNNGAKWETDESTRKHAANLNAQVNEFSKNENTGSAAYHDFSDQVQSETDQLIKDCRMKGAAHDALHLWLESVLQDLIELKKATTSNEGKQSAQKLTEDVKKFNQYFN